MKGFYTLVLLLMATVSFADEVCDHPVFVTHECLDTVLQNLGQEDNVSEVL